MPQWGELRTRIRTLCPDRAVRGQFPRNADTNPDIASGSRKKSCSIPKFGQSVLQDTPGEDADGMPVMPIHDIGTTSVLKRDHFVDVNKLVCIDVTRNHFADAGKMVTCWKSGGKE